MPDCSAAIFALITLMVLFPAFLWLSFEYRNAVRSEREFARTRRAWAEERRQRNHQQEF